MQIDVDTVQEIQALIDSGQSLKEATKAKGISDIGLRNACARLQVALPKGLTLSDRLQPYLEDYRLGLKSQTDLAAIIGVSQGSICNALRVCDTKKPKHEISKAQAAQAVEYVRKHGGFITAAIKELDLQIPVGVARAYAKSIGVDLTHFQFAHERHSYWQILPGPFVQVNLRTLCLPSV